MNVNTIGAVSEFKATIWLLEQDYLVFHNVKSTGAADLIAFNPETEEIIIIDVKTIRKSSNGQYTNMPRKWSQNNLIKYLCYCPDDDTFQWITKEK